MSDCIRPVRLKPALFGVQMGVYRPFQDRDTPNAAYRPCHPNGSKYWRLKYRYQGVEKLQALGVYPEVSLKEARALRDRSCEMLAENIDPGENKKAIRTSRFDAVENSFEVIAREWFAIFKTSVVPDHADRIMNRLERDIFPWIGRKPIAEITAPEILAVLRRITSRGAIETAHRAKTNIGQIMRYGIATGRTDRNPTPDLKGALPSPRVKDLAAVIEPEKVGELLRVIDTYIGSFTVRCALQLAPLVFVRPGELRQAKWADINLERAEWRYFVLKTKTDHLVPLSKQAVKILKEIFQLTGTDEYVFPSPNAINRPMSNNAVLSAFRRMGISKEEITGHGFRAMARTLLAEELDFRPEIIEHQLAHKVPDALGRAYNRTRFIKERTQMMQRWADYLDELKSQGQRNP